MSLYKFAYVLVLGFETFILYKADEYMAKVKEQGGKEGWWRGDAGSVRGFDIWETVPCTSQGSELFP